MAVDTAQRRADATQLLHAFYGPIIIPDASLTQPDRQSAANIYSGISAGEAPPVVVEEETQPTGGWPSYGYRRKKRRRPVEEVEEKIEAQEFEIEATEAKLAKERAEQQHLEAKARQSKRDREHLENLKSLIAKDMQVIEEMRRIHDELITLKYLEQTEDRKRRKRNQLIILMMEA